jgi:hypothetical protein
MLRYFRRDSLKRCVTLDSHSSTARNASLKHFTTSGQALRFLRLTTMPNAMRHIITKRNHASATLFFSTLRRRFRYCCSASWSCVLKVKAPSARVRDCEPHRNASPARLHYLAYLATLPLLLRVADASIANDHCMGQDRRAGRPHVRASVLVAGFGRQHVISDCDLFML